MAVVRAPFGFMTGSSEVECQGSGLDTPNVSSCSNFVARGVRDEN